MEHTANQAAIRGTLLELPQFSHENHGSRFYRFLLEVPRLSGAVDHLPVIAREEALNQMDLSGGSYVEVRGQVRSFNNHSSVGQRLADFRLCRLRPNQPGGALQPGPSHRDHLQGSHLPPDPPGPGNLRCDAGGAPVLPALRLPALHSLGADRPGHISVRHRRYHFPHRPPAKQTLPESHRRRRGGPHRL